MLEDLPSRLVTLLRVKLHYLHVNSLQTTHDKSCPDVVVFLHPLSAPMIGTSPCPKYYLLHWFRFDTDSLVR